MLAAVVSDASDESMATTAQTRRRGAPKRDDSMTAQVNVRLDPELKQEADRAFADAHIRPSEAIRSLYQRAASLGDALQSVSQLFESRAICDDETTRREHRHAALLRAEGALDSILTDYGLRLDLSQLDPSQLAPMSNEEIEDAVFADFLQEGMV